VSSAASTAFGCPLAGSTADASIQASRGGYTQSMVTLALTTGSLHLPSQVQTHGLTISLIDFTASRYGVLLRRGHGYRNERERTGMIPSQICPAEHSLSWQQNCTLLSSPLAGADSTYTQVQGCIPGCLTFLSHSGRLLVWCSFLPGLVSCHTLRSSATQHTMLSWRPNICCAWQFWYVNLLSLPLVLVHCQVTHPVRCPGVLRPLPGPRAF
jgi:hypothetical protein